MSILQEVDVCDAEQPVVDIASGGYAIALLGISYPVEKLEIVCLEMITVNQGKFASPLYPVSFPSA